MWREKCPELVIRSTFIAGFPGETEEEFQTLLDFLREAQIDRAGCFAYSPVEGATANEIADGSLPQTNCARNAARASWRWPRKSRQRYKVGDFVSVKISGADGHDLWGEV
jgi:ribosomal protein S12 methylthiotransferase